MTLSMPSNIELRSTVDCLWPVNAQLGEGLVYQPVGRRLWFIDIKQPRLFCYSLNDAAQRTYPLSTQVSALALPPLGWRPPVTGETVLLCVGALGFAWLAVDGGNVTLHPITDPEADLPGNRFNDGKIGPDGRFYAGTMDDSETEASGAFYVLDANGKTARLDTGYRVTNGPAFSPDGRVIYHNDSALRRTFAFDLDRSGAVSGKRLFHAHDSSGGYPDGMTTDADGNLFVAMWDGHRVQRLDASGCPTGYIPVPVSRPTTCVFIDPGVLAFTSAAIGLKQPMPLDGGLFRVRF
ncbi:MAG: SMP-30/gluconolactonase/LRE family protein [Hyphomicrobium sp.]